MRLPGGAQAVVDIAKLRDYCLNPLHPRGRHKARVFSAALHFTQADAALLRAKLLDAALRGEAAFGQADEFGQRYVLDFDCVNGRFSAIVRSSWIVRRGDSYPRFITCYVLSR